MNQRKIIFSSLCLLIGAFSQLPAFAFTTSDADALWSAYTSTYFVTNGGNAYYKSDNGTGTSPGWWTFAEEIEMAEDAYDNAPSLVRQNMVAALCNGFTSRNGSLWTGNIYNDDITWGVIAFSRAYLITGNTNFRTVAKNNFDAMYSRAWETNFTGGGLWWNTDKQGKNACINGPAAVAACYLYNIFGDRAYLSKAQDCYAWERRVLLNTNTGAISDSISTNNSINTWASTYNQGTFIGAGNFLFRITGLPTYYQDAILEAKYTQTSIASAGIMPEYGSGDFGGFNGIFLRWVAKFAKDQNLWSSYGPWLNTNANAAWGVRNTNNIAWEKWLTATPAGTNVLASWDCSDAIIVTQVATPNSPDALQITPTAGFTAVAQRAILPNTNNVVLTLTNTGATTFNWSLANTSTWLSVSANSGTLTAGGAATSVSVSLIPAVTTNLSAGRYYANIGFTNQSSGLVASRQFTLVVSAGDAPIALTGYNSALLAPNSATTATPKATAFDIPNSYCFYQAGLNSSTRGLPPDGVFTGLFDGTTVFQFPTYGVTNTLALGYTYPASATLNLVTPQAYNSISILACSANTAASVGTLVLNYTNGTHSQAFNFNALDWFAASTNMAIQGIGRLRLGASFSPIDNGPVNPNMYQTTINLGALGLNQTIGSITFNKPVGAGAQQTVGIFAVSGLVAYHEPVIVQQPSPTNSLRFVGATNTWTVAVNAGYPFSYNWCQNGTVIPTATNSTYSIGNLQTNHSGNYTVVISNSYGMVTSSVASLTVVPGPTYPYAQSVLGDHALGYWRLDETSGSVAHDAISTNSGSYTSKVLLGQIGDKLLDTHLAARFGSLATSNSCVTNIAVDFGTGNNGTFSVEAWVSGGSQTTDAGIVTKGYGSGGEQFNLDCGGGSHAFRFFVRDAAGAAHVASSSIIPNSQWHHLVGVCDEANGYVCLYVDGTNVAQAIITANSGILSSSLLMSIGSRQSGAATTYDNQFSGYIEEVALYGSALSTNQVRTHYLSVSNRPPIFLSNPFSLATANAGQLYSATLVATASEPNGDAITYAKISGPVWLSVAANGNLSGTPLSSAVGTNSFVVRASDPNGLFSTATLNIMVLAAPPIVSSASLQGTDLLLNWAGGVAPFQVQFTTNLFSPDWQSVGDPVSANNLLVSPTNDTIFYRVIGQ